MALVQFLGSLKWRRVGTEHIIEPTDPGAYEIVRHVTNHYHGNHWLTSVDVAGPYRRVVKWESPPPGSVLLVRLYKHQTEKPREEGFQILLFDGNDWQLVRRHPGILVQQDLTLTVIVGQAVLIPVAGREESFLHHVLNYWAGQGTSLGDLILIDRELRLRPKLKSLLQLTATLKGAVKSDTAAQIHALAQELLLE